MIRSTRLFVLGLVCATGAFAGAANASTPPGDTDYAVPTVVEVSRNEPWKAALAQVAAPSAPESSVALFHPSTDAWRLVSRSPKGSSVIFEVPEADAPTHARPKAMRASS